MIQNKDLSLPSRFGGLKILFYEQAKVECNNSKEYKGIKTSNIQSTKLKSNQAKQVIKKENENRYHSNIAKLKKNLSVKSKRLLEISKYRGVSN